MNRKKLLLFPLVTVLMVSIFLSALAQKAPAFAPANEMERRRQAMYCFFDAAFGSEYGGSSGLVRWGETVRLSLEGDYTEEDEAFAMDFLKQLREAAIPGMPEVIRVDALDTPNIRVTFAPLDRLNDYVTNYVTGNWGFFGYRYEEYLITRASIAIASDITGQEARNHLFLEELVGALGLATDIYTYSDSIIYQPWTEVQTLSDLDWLMLTYLYSPLLEPGMSVPQAHAELFDTLAPYR